jgi:dienelactone hydrolase
LQGIVPFLSIAAALSVGQALAPGQAGAPASPRLDPKELHVAPGPDGKPVPVKTAADWKLRRESILKGMEEVMGPVRERLADERLRKLPLDLRVEEETPAGTYVRKRISFASEPGDRVPAYLLVPRERRGKLPAVLCLHQTTEIGKGEPAGLGGKENLRYAVHLVERGYVTIAPDYPNFGDHRFPTYERGYVSGTAKAIWDNVRAVDLLVSLPEVDGERLGAIGHSLGGHNAMFTAVFDERLRAVVSSCGFNAFAHYYGGDLRGWSSKTYMPRIAARRPAAMPFDFHEVVAAFAPRAFFASAPLHDANFAVEGVKEAVASARPVYRLLGVEERLAVLHPDCEHDFPPAAREAAYAWLDRWLK